MNISVYIEGINNQPIADWGWSAYLGFKMNTDRIIFFEDIEEVPSYQSIVVACIETSNKYLDRLGIPSKKEINIPESIECYAQRKITHTTMREVRKNIEYPIFIKGNGKSKYLNAGVVYKPEHLHLLFEDAPDEAPVMTSEPIDIISEYRVYVCDNQILGVYNYLGDKLEFPNGNIIQDCIKDYKDAPAGYGIDFAVTGKGETVLIEVNDGYALGNYGLENHRYSRLLSRRWMELLKERTK